MKLTRFIPWVILVIAAGAVFSALRPAPEKGFHTNAFGKLPVILNGRLQPLDSVARNSLLVIRTKQTVLLEDRKSMPAIDWLLEVFAQPEVANTRKIFRIDHPELLDLLKLPHDQQYFAFNQLVNSIGDLQQEAERVGKIDEKQRTAFERAVMKLANSMWLYDRLKNSIMPEGVHNVAAEVADYEKILKPGLAALHAREAGKPADEAVLTKLNDFFQRYQTIANVAYPLLIPPSEGRAQADWQTFPASLLQSLRNGEINPAAQHYATMCNDFHDKKIDNFNQSLTQYKLWLEQHNFRQFSI